LFQFLRNTGQTFSEFWFGDDDQTSMKEWLIIHPIVRDDNDLLTFFGVDDYLNEGRDREGG
jgi:hypothetical protein